MHPLLAYFKASHLYYTSYLYWATPNTKIREYHLHIAKRDMELARALLNVERKRLKRRTYQ